MPTNAAAWIRAKHAQLEVGPAPYTPPADDQIVVRNHAVAVNPLDWIVQVEGNLTFRWLDYPTVLGSDVAGEVVEAGRAVTRFRVGDRVLAHAVSTDKDSNRPGEGGFQLYTAVLERLACPIPDTMPFQDAAVLPLAISTAACGLFQTDQLALRHPAANAGPTGQTLLVWGGSTSVGSNAIQLAVAAGYQVITTASPHNFDHVTTLGAAQVFDHHSPTAVPDIIAAFRGRTLAGAIAIGSTGAESCVRIVGESQGNRLVAIASPPVSFANLAPEHRRRSTYPRLVLRLLTSNVAMQVKARRHGTRTKFIFATTIKTNDICTAIYRDFLPDALASGRYLATPTPAVVGTSLHDLQHAMDVQRHGVSASKVVVTLT